ncbi:hypothetical protein J4409_02790 [Candidatus Woesearchaeota archaeon]|nr:hypothetical protein [Candidatus Woesearchaeota archaeon]
MRKIVCIMLAAILAMIMVPFVAADTPGSGIGINLTVDPSAISPYIWMNPDSRIMLRSGAGGSGEAIQRVNNYAFEGEQIEWQVLAMDENGVETISDVSVYTGSSQGIGDNQEVTCDENTTWVDGDDITLFNAMVDGTLLTAFDSDTMAVYQCILTVIPSMYDEWWVMAQVTDADFNTDVFDENEFWFFNPVVALVIDGTMDFGSASPGTMAYSGTVSVTNDADVGSGVLLDMQISGEDFYDPTSSGAKCPVTNRLKLNNGGTAPSYENEGVDIAADPTLAGRYTSGDQSDCDSPSDAAYQDAADVGDADDLGIEGIDGFTGVDPLCYFATNGAYSSANDADRRDDEGYLGIAYATSDDDNRDPIITSTDAADIITYGGVEYFAGNVLDVGSDLSVTFRVLIPEPCSGSFSEGSIWFWGEAI